MEHKSTVSLAVFVIFVSCCYYVAESSHQKWWILGCPCRQWDQRKSLHHMIMRMYHGLFVTRRGLRRLPIIKPFGDKAHGHGTGSYVGNTVPTFNRSQQSCCNTDYAYEVVNATVSRGRKLHVVHFDHAFQFVPTGRCPKKTTCGRGTCIQMYRHHWMLVWDDHLPHYPPVKFVPVELPSHCECVNVGA